MFGFWSVSGSNTAANELYGFVSNTGTFSSFDFNLGEQGVVFGMRRKNRAGPQMRCGAWNLLEIEMRLNDIGVDNGLLRVKVNGQLTHEYGDIRYRTAAFPRGFKQRKMAPTWGGNSATPVFKQRTDTMIIAHWTIQGQPLNTSGGGTVAVASVSISPTSFTMGDDTQRLLTATARSSSGSILTGRAMTWTSSNPSVLSVVGSTSNPGSATVTANTIGTATVTVSCEGKTGTSAGTVVSSSGGSSKEPAGYAVICRTPCDTLPPTFPKTAIPGGVGTWGKNATSNLTIESVAGAPSTPPNVLRTRWLDTLSGGDSPCLWAMWSSTPGEYREIYVRYRFRFVESTFDNNPSNGTKWGFINYARTTEDAAGAANQGTFFLDATGSVQPRSSFKLSFRQQNSITRNILQNVNTSALINAGGVWNTMEAVLKLNTKSGGIWQPNGVFQMWANGTLICNYDDVRWLGTSTGGDTSSTGINLTHGFDAFKWDPTWTGSGFEKNETNHVDFDEVYISGVRVQENDPIGPFGTTTIVETNFSSIPAAGTSFTSTGMITGEQNRGSGTGSNVSVVSDSTAPNSPNNVLQVEFSNGLGDGVSGFGQMDFWAAGRGANSAGFAAKTKLYVRFFLKLVGTDFQNQSVGTKLLYIPYANTTRGNHSFLLLDGDGSSVTTKPNGTVTTSFRLDWWITQMDGLTGNDPGFSTATVGLSSRPIVVGDWHKIELFMTKNTNLNADGLCQLWIDDVLCINTTKRWVSPANPLGFWNIHKDEVWGGDIGQVKDRDDFVRWDHLYVSGS
jgi:hypothetical protein